MRAPLRGFGLVELMVAMLLGLTLVLALLQYLGGSRDAWLLQQLSARQQEDARYLLGRLARDIRAAGSYGCLDLQRLLPQGLPADLAQPVRFDQGVLTLITGLPVQVAAEEPQPMRAADFGARWLLAGDCQQRVGLADEHALSVMPGDWLLPLRLVEYRQQDDRVQVRLNGNGNFETLIEGVTRFEPRFALAADASAAGVSGRYQPGLDEAEQERLRSVRIALELSDRSADTGRERMRTLVFRQVTQVRNRPDWGSDE